MKRGKISSRRVTWSVTLLWVTAGTFRSLPMTTAFLQDSRTSKPLKRNPCDDGPSGRSIASDPLKLLPNQESNGPMTSGDNTQASSFESTSSTRINMVGPLLEEEQRGILGESARFSSPCNEGHIARCQSSLAHGILCPETVARMETVGASNRAVGAFLDRYHKHGPMSCMELLSDPEILSHLTSAMRGLP